MTYTDVATSVADLETQLEVARQAKVAQEREAAAQAASARRAVWQEWLDTYDRRALRGAVHATWAGLCDALREGGEVGTALVEHVRAILAEARADGLASDAVAAGASLPAGREVGPGQVRDATGQVVSEQMATLVPMLLGRAVVEIADRDTAAEAEEVRARAERAYAGTLLAEPTGYRVESARRADYLDTIGGAGTVAFADGVGYVMRAEVGDERLGALVRYWRGTPGYVVHEVYDAQVPQHHVEALRRLGDAA